MSQKTKSLIFDKITEVTMQFCSSKTLRGDTVSISNDLFVSRSLVSLHLNEMHKEGLLIKLNTRPVYFLNKKVIEKTFKITIHELVFDSIDDLTDLLDERMLNKGSFITAVGHDGSLNYCIKQMQAAVKYPNNGIPVLLIGESGVGKTFLADLLAKYCVYEGFLTNSQPRKISIGKTEDDKIIYEKLFGKYDSKLKQLEPGLLLKCKNGVLIIDNVHRLSENILIQLISFLKNGYYLIDGFDKQIDCSVRVILTSMPNNQVNEYLIEEIPVICKIPSLSERPFVERENLILSQFQLEEKGISKKIYITEKVFYSLVHYHYKMNIKELQSIIKMVCANAYSDNDEMMIVKSYHLPESFLEAMTEDVIKNNDDSIIQIDDFKSEKTVCSTIPYFDLLLSVYAKYLNNGINESQFLELGFERMNDYYEYIVFENKYENNRIKSFEQCIKILSDDIFDKYQVFLPMTCIYTLSKVIYSLAYDNSVILNWQNDHKSELLSFKKYCKLKFHKSFVITEELSLQIKNILDIEMDIANLLFLFLNIHFYNTEVDNIHTNCLIVAHGYSTASSIADAVNKIVGVHIFDGIDMPINTSVTEIIVHINNYLKKINNSKDIIVLVDMGSLEQMDELINDSSCSSFGMINNVNTKLALDVAMKIKQGIDIDTIIKSAANENVCKYKIKLASKKQNMIIFTTEVGETATERVIQLFKNSMPRNIDLGIIPYSYTKLSKNKNKDEIFNKYNVIMVVGINSISGLNVPTVSLEDLVAFSDFDDVTNNLKKYMKDEEVIQFNKNLLKNFSLSNILDNVVILNANVLFEKVEKAVGKLEKNYNIIIPNKAKIGLYLHLCCLVERLVLKTDEKVEIEENTKLSKDIEKFIKIFYDSFTDVSDHYNKIKFPVNEIVYLYSYIDKFK
ncbi:sigma 54-interacting transcriptional regulator [Anaerorhabdus sp.]|uniref:sigma 54-interacting transcriptional regulator n=1 Tax=Anaerorhabdus sp. TaxID=1872524 RepID=UPI002FCC9D94